MSNRIFVNVKRERFIAQSLQINSPDVVPFEMVALGPSNSKSDYNTDTFG